MLIYKTQESLQHKLQSCKSEGLRIGFVPTMGALHQGHLTLIQEAKKKSDIVVCSIFVNPTQFNDPKDLEKYPRPIEKDEELLKETGCHILFLPSVDEMYPPDEPDWHIDLNRLDTIWEGEHRPGHFQGVTQIVYKLFTLVQPDVAFFGQKDFQQVMVIQHMVKVKKLPVELSIVATVRDQNGLALSSRNSRLSPIGLHKALILSKSLRFISDHLADKTVNKLLSEAKNMILQEVNVDIEYLAICESSTLQPVTEVLIGTTYVAIVAAWVENVRLIDNILLELPADF